MQTNFNPTNLSSKHIVMKKVIALLHILLVGMMGFAQNVGIGTSTPAELLHLFSNSANVKIRLTSVANDTRSGIEYVTGGGASDLSRFGAAAGSSTAGISMNGNTRLYTSGGSLLIGNDAAQPIYFVTNNEVKMTLNGNGNVGLGTAMTGDDRLVVAATAGRGITSTTSFIPGPSNFTSAVAGIVSNTSLRAHGITGVAQNASGSTTGTIGGMYGVVGTAIEAGYGMGAFGAAGAGGIFSYVFSGSGKALSTYGAVQLQNIGEGAGRVLTSDAGGNATWQNLAGSHTHYGEFWSGALPTGLSISTSNGTNSAAIRATASSTSGQALGIIASSASVNGVAIIGYNNSVTSNYHPFAENTGVAGVAGSGIGLFGASISGTSIYGQKLNFGSATGSVAIFENLKTGLSDPVVFIRGTSAQPAIELNNGYLKVSGTNKTAFMHTTAAGNISSNITTLTYANPSSSDMIFVTHNYSPTNFYFNKAFGVFWTGATWAIYTEDLSNMPANINFNVLVIKQ